MCCHANLWHTKLDTQCQKLAMVIGQLTLAPAHVQWVINTPLLQHAVIYKASAQELA